MTTKGVRFRFNKKGEDAPVGYQLGRTRPCVYTSFQREERGGRGPNCFVKKKKETKPATANRKKITKNSSTSAVATGEGIGRTGGKWTKEAQKNGRKERGGWGGKDREEKGRGRHPSNAEGGGKNRKGGCFGQSKSGSLMK